MRNETESTMIVQIHVEEGAPLFPPYNDQAFYGVSTPRSKAVFFKLAPGESLEDFIILPGIDGGFIMQERIVRLETMEGVGPIETWPSFWRRFLQKS